MVDELFLLPFIVPYSWILGEETLKNNLGIAVLRTDWDTEEALGTTYLGVPNTYQADHVLPLEYFINLLRAICED